jgi:hypothetical protein
MKKYLLVKIAHNLVHQYVHNRATTLGKLLKLHVTIMVVEEVGAQVHIMEVLENQEL